MRIRLGSAVFVFAALVAPSAEAQTQSCDRLSSLSSATTSVTLAEPVAAGAFKEPPSRGPRLGADPFPALPSFCRVAATLEPTPQSQIRMEVWMPAAGWNGKLQVVGNGGFAGDVGHRAMARALAAGYSAASTDTGHSGDAASTFANKEVVIDFAHRAVHETTVAAKRFVDAFYGAPPTLSYFNGCSTGGRQGLTAAQRYPDDFDGIVAGAPAVHGLNLAFGQIWIAQAMSRSAASVIPDEKLQMLHSAVLQACDATDGVRDGVLEDPIACRFDPNVLACKQGADGANCLTAAQVEAARKIYGGARNTRTGNQVFPGLEPGTERDWSPRPVGYAVDLFRHMVFRNANWDPNWLNFDGHYALTAETEFKLFDADNPDLSAYFKSGGKLLIYHGWNDAGIPPRGSVSYYETVRAKTGTAADSGLRLFMVPGMGHCRGGDGTDTFDAVAALDQWVTSGKAPASIPASRVRDGKVDRTRPICAYPQIAVYKGSGSVDDAANFECRTR